MMRKGALFQCVFPEGHHRTDDSKLFNNEEIKQKERQAYSYQHPCNLMHSEKQETVSVWNDKKYHHIEEKIEEKNYHDELAESSKSEEEAATTIQAIYRGYKARRKFNEIRKSSSEEQQKAKRVAELLAMPVVKNLHKPLEPVKVSASFLCKDENFKDNKISGKNIGDSKPIGNNFSIQDNNQRTSSHKDLEGLRFDVISPQPTPRGDKKYRQNKLQGVKSSTNLVDTSKPIETIKSPAFFNRCDERLSSVTQSENTDTDDQFSPRIIEGGERSMIDLQTTRESFRKNITYNNKEKTRLENNENLPKAKTRIIRRQNIITNQNQKQLPQRMSTSILGDQEMKNYYQKNSLFYPDREAVLIFGGIDPHEEYGCTGNSGKDMYRFKPSENNWEFVGEIPEPRHHHSVVYLKGKIYLAGGADPRGNDNIDKKNLVVGTVWSYDPTCRIWFNEPGMLTPRKNFNLVVSHGKMFAIGGQDKNGIALKTVEAFDPNENMWKEMRSMFTARIGAASVKYKNRIWIAGGMTKSKKEPLSKEVECYDPSENLWLKATPLRSPRCFASLYVVSERLYMIGGAGNTSKTIENFTESIASIDVWDQNICEWRKETEMTIARHGHTIGSIGGQILIIGGVTTVYMGTLRSVECYCCERSNWIKGVSSLPYAISGHGTVSLPPVNLLMDPK